MRAKLVIVVLVCLLLVHPTLAFAAPPPPDESTGGEPAVPASPAPDLRALGPNAPDATLKWYTVAGAGFIPYTNALTWTYGGSGCLAPSASGYWRANVNLPDGSIMKQIYFGFYNSATSTTSTAYIYRYNYTGALQAVVQLTSTSGAGGNTGYKSSFATITAPGETVYNYTNAYMFSWSGSGNQQLCYIQVGYTPPSIFAVAVPAVMR
jgi:hypothetical protein